MLLEHERKLTSTLRAIQKTHRFPFRAWFWTICKELSEFQLERFVAMSGHRRGLIQNCTDVEIPTVLAPSD
jgi:hypothetical protein